MQQSGLIMARTGVSQITRMELLGFPALGEQEEQAARAFLSCCEVVRLSDDIENETIRLRRHGGLKLPDAIVAATARVCGARLLTLDQRLARVMQDLP